MIEADLKCRLSLFEFTKASGLSPQDALVKVAVRARLQAK
jgi:hypothetical protein